MTGTTTYDGGASLSGGLIYTDLDPSAYSNSDTRGDSAPLDGFSIRISVTSGTFEIDPKATYDNALGSKVQTGTAGSTGFDSNATTTTPSVPEPGTLLRATWPDWRWVPRASAGPAPQAWPGFSVPDERGPARNHHPGAGAQLCAAGRPERR